MRIMGPAIGILAGMTGGTLALVADWKWLSMWLLVSAGYNFKLFELRLLEEGEEP